MTRPTRRGGLRAVQGEPVAGEAVEDARTALAGVALLRDLDSAVLVRLGAQVEHRTWIPRDLLVEQAFDALLPTLPGRPGLAVGAVVAT